MKNILFFITSLGGWLLYKTGKEKGFDDTAFLDIPYEFIIPLAITLMLVITTILFFKPSNK